MFRYIDLDPRALRRMPSLQGSVARRALDVYERVDDAVIDFLRRHSETVLRLALATVFIWFGALKLIDRSPVATLVADTIAWVPSSFVVPALGAVEVAIGFGLLFGIGLRIVLLLFVLQMLGTFLVFVTQPGDSFQDGNPLLLTTLGEFVVKNVVLIAAGLVIGSHVHSKREQSP